MNLLHQYNLQHFLSTDIPHWLIVWGTINIVLERIADSLRLIKRLRQEIKELSKSNEKTEQSPERKQDNSTEDQH